MVFSISVFLHQFLQNVFGCFAEIVVQILLRAHLRNDRVVDIRYIEDFVHRQTIITNVAEIHIPGGLIPLTHIEQERARFYGIKFIIVYFTVGRGCILQFILRRLIAEARKHCIPSERGHLVKLGCFIVISVAFIFRKRCQSRHFQY